MLPTARSTWVSVTGTNDVPPFVERHIPPVADPIKTICGSKGETATAFIRPDVAPPGNEFVVGNGPMGDQTLMSAFGPNLFTSCLLRRGIASQASLRTLGGISLNG